MTPDRPYMVCTRCVMDTSDPDISFDSQGVCNHCHHFDRLLARHRLSAEEMASRREALLQKVRSGKRGTYDSIVGLSGGIDSSYVAYLAGQHRLNPLVVHFDNGWNSEIAVSNIKKIVSKLGFDLYTYVIDWEEFRDLQRAFFKASVIDIEMVTDHAIFASMFKIAKDHGIRYVLSGTNFRTEHTMPKAWYWRKQDLPNLKDIHRQYGEGRLKTFPMLTTWRFQAAKQLGFGQEYIELLHTIDYRRGEAMQTLEREFGWQYYGGKHYESTFTKFYQAHVLPVKFKVDKRRAHYTDLIHNQEMTRPDALALLERPAYDPAELAADRSYVLKKLGFTSEEFDRLMAEPPRPHSAFKSDQRLVDLMMRARTVLRS